MGNLRPAQLSLEHRPGRGEHYFNVVLFGVVDNFTKQLDPAICKLGWIYPIGIFNSGKVEVGSA